MLLTGAMTLSLAACGGTSTGSDAGTDSGADSGSDSYKIALIQQHQTNAFQIGVTEGAQAKADELGVELNILSADQDAAKQISQIEQCVSEGYDAILFEPVDPDGLRFSRFFLRSSIRCRRRRHHDKHRIRLHRLGVRRHLCRVLRRQRQGRRE